MGNRVASRVITLDEVSSAVGDGECGKTDRRQVSALLKTLTSVTPSDNVLEDLMDAQHVKGDRPTAEELRRVATAFCDVLSARGVSPHPTRSKTERYCFGHGAARPPGVPVSARARPRLRPRRWASPCGAATRASSSTACPASRATSASASARSSSSPGAAKGRDVPNYLGRFSLVSADFWTSDHLEAWMLLPAHARAERSR
jgi:hypothetical protein